jgi:hypothetical protein
MHEKNKYKDRLANQRAAYEREVARLTQELADGWTSMTFKGPALARRKLFHRQGEKFKDVVAALRKGLPDTWARFRTDLKFTHGGRHIEDWDRTLREVCCNPCPRELFDQG